MSAMAVSGSENLLLKMRPSFKVISVMAFSLSAVVDDVVQIKHSFDGLIISNDCLKVKRLFDIFSNKFLIFLSVLNVNSFITCCVR